MLDFYQGETHKGAHERNNVAYLRIKNVSFARFAQVLFCHALFFVCFYISQPLLSYSRRQMTCFAVV